MNIRSLQRGLRYCGRVKAVRQTYHVFEAEGYFFVLSFALSKTRRGSGYFNVIDTDAVDYVQQRVGGTGAILPPSRCHRNGVAIQAATGRGERRKRPAASRAVSCSRSRCA